LTQEVRNPRAGQFTLKVWVCGRGASAEAYRDGFLNHFSCRLVIFGYADNRKDPARVTEFASLRFQPPYADGRAGGYEAFELNTILRSQDGGAFQLSRGVGLAIVVEKTTHGELAWTAPAFVCVDDVELRYVPRPRNDDVQV
jgi:hypothetical protein